MPLKPCATYECCENKGQAEWGPLESLAKCKTVSDNERYQTNSNSFNEDNQVFMRSVEDICDAIEERKQD